MEINAQGYTLKIEVSRFIRNTFIFLAS